MAEPIRESRTWRGTPLAADVAWSFTTGASINPQPAGWYSGDVHVHRSCGGSPVPVSTIYDAMVAQDLNVVSLLADMGNGEVQDPVTDLPKVTGQDDPISTAGRIVHWDTEWHWDATYTQYPHQALGGHLLNLGLTEAHQIWDESTYPIEQWAHQQGGISGFAHMQYLNDSIPTSLTCCTPVEYPVEVALGGADFIEEDVNGSDTAINAYSRLLNCGFRPGLAAGTDYPCGQVIGPMVTFAQVAGGQLTYRDWVDAIGRGRTVVSRVGSGQFAALQVNGTATPGDEIQLTGAGDVSVSVQWTANQSVSGTIELVQNGAVVASQPATAAPGTPGSLTATAHFTQSGWLSARVMNDGVSGHALQTAAVFVTVAGAPVRASATDAQFYVDWMDALITNTSPGGVWNSYFPTELAAAQARYQAARTIYQQIAAGGDVAPTVVSHLPASGAAGVPVGSSVSATFNEALDPATVNGSTFLLKDAAQAPVAASVSYDAGLRTAILTPSSPLAYSTTYTATLKGGSTDPRIKSAAGTAMAADVSWSFTTQAPDLTPPTVTSTSPASGASGVALSATVNATFSEALDPATVTSGTFELHDPSNGLVAATVSYDAANLRATLQPTSSLGSSTAYTATLKGGASGIKDIAGNALAVDSTGRSRRRPRRRRRRPRDRADRSSSSARRRTRSAATRSRSCAPKGSTSSRRRTSRSSRRPMLADYDVVILGRDAAQRGAGHDADRLDHRGRHADRDATRQAAGRSARAHADAAGTLADKYLLVNTARGPGRRHRRPDDAVPRHRGPLHTERRDQRSRRSTPTPRPRPRTRRSPRAAWARTAGKAVAFTYDLARSVVYTRQGNPAWSGQKRDGQIEPDPLGRPVLRCGRGDSQPDWVDFNKVAIPQADEQQRLLANAIILGNLHRKPLPRFWYLPKGLKAAIVMTGDNHGDGGMACRFDIYRSQSPAELLGGRLGVRARHRVRVLRVPGFTDAQASFYNNLGFEVAVHINTNCARATQSQYERLRHEPARRASPRRSRASPSRRRTATTASRGATGARFPRSRPRTASGSTRTTTTGRQRWILNRSGMFTGSGIPMRFAKLDGTIIDVYQAATEMPDESGESLPVVLRPAARPRHRARGLLRRLHDQHALRQLSPRGLGRHRGLGPGARRAGGVGEADADLARRPERLVVRGPDLEREHAELLDRDRRGLAQHAGDGADDFRRGTALTGITLQRLAGRLHHADDQGHSVRVLPGDAGQLRGGLRLDTTPPVISAVAAAPHDDGTATITWTTNEAVRLARGLRHDAGRAHAQRQRRGARDEPQHHADRPRAEHHLLLPRHLGRRGEQLRHRADRAERAAQLHHAGGGLLPRPDDVRLRRRVDGRRDLRLHDPRRRGHASPRRRGRIRGSAADDRVAELRVCRRWDLHSPRVAC